MKERLRNKSTYYLNIAVFSAIFLFLFLYLPYAIRKTVSKKREKETLSAVKEKAQGLSMSKEAVIDVLKLIEDPEFHENIYDLGIVKSIKVDGKNIEETRIQGVDIRELHGHDGELQRMENPLGSGRTFHHYSK